MTITYVPHFINYYEGTAWHALESYAVGHPDSAKWFSVAAMIGECVKHLFVPLAELAEHVFLSLKKDYEVVQIWLGNTTGSTEKLLDSSKEHISSAALSILKILISPFIGAYHAMTTFLSVFNSPLKAAKIRAAECDLFVYLENIPSTSHAEEIINLAFQRFKTRVETLENPTEVSEQHFIDSPLRKNQLDKLVRQKRELLEKLWDRRLEPIDEVTKSRTLVDVSWSQWLSIQRQIIEDEEISETVLP